MSLARSAPFALCGFTVAFVLAAASAVGAQSPLKVEEKVAYLGSPNNIKISNGIVELIVSTDYGPRILRYALAGSGDADNLFATIPGVTLKTDLGEWWIRGGHRLWHAPESLPFTYEPDNDPVPYKIEGNTVKLLPPVEKTTRIQKEIWITLDPKSSHVTLVHKLTNKGFPAVEMACWALSVMNAGGVGIYPHEPYASHDDDLLPARPMVLWSYTNMADPRWMWGKSLFTLRQDTTNKEPQKLGFLNKQGWVGYLRNKTLFLKRMPYEPGRTYPDFGCNVETYTNDVMLEIETLSPLQMVQRGQSITHTEHWWLYKDVDAGNTEASIAAALQPILTETSRAK